MNSAGFKFNCEGPDLHGNSEFFQIPISTRGLSRKSESPRRTQPRDLALNLIRPQVPGEWGRSSSKKRSKFGTSDREVSQQLIFLQILVYLLVSRPLFENQKRYIDIKECNDYDDEFLNITACCVMSSQDLQLVLSLLYSGQEQLSNRLVGRLIQIMQHWNFLVDAAAAAYPSFKISLSSGFYADKFHLSL